MSDIVGQRDRLFAWDVQMTASRLRALATIGVDQMAALADRVENKSVLRLAPRRVSGDG